MSVPGALLAADVAGQEEGHYRDRQPDAECNKQALMMKQRMTYDAFGAEPENVAEPDKQACPY